MTGENLQKNKQTRHTRTQDRSSDEAGALPVRRLVALLLTKQHTQEQEQEQEQHKRKKRAAGYPQKNTKISIVYIYLVYIYIFLRGQTGRSSDTKAASKLPGMLLN